MKKIHKISIATLATLMCVGGAVALASHAKEATKVEAALNLPNIQSGTSYKYRWDLSSNPTNGTQALDVSTSNSTSISYQCSRDATYDYPFAKITESSTSNFVADVLPIYIPQTISSYYYTERTYTFDISISGNGSSVKSAELFYYSNADISTATNASQYAKYWLYTSDSTSTSTGYAFSLGRIATTGSTATKTVTASVKADNFTTGNRNVYFHFGLYVYKAQGSGTLNAQVTMKSYTGGDAHGTVAVNDVFYSTQAAAQTAYNSKSESIMKLYDTFSLTADLVLNSHNGRIELSSRTLLANTYSFYIQKETTIKGYGIINGSANTMFIMNVDNVDLYITQNVTINHSGTTRAVWISTNAADSGIHIANSCTIASTNTNAATIWMDGGKVYCAGTVQAPNATCNAIYGGSSDIRKTIYIYSEASIQGFVRVWSLSNTFIRGTYNGTAYSGNNSVRIKVEGACQPGLTVVYDVTDDNASKFLLTRQYFTLERSGNNLVAAYTTYTIAFDLTHILAAYTTTTVSHFEEFHCTLSADSGYKLPAAISVTEVNGGAAVAHTYNSTTGLVYIADEVISSNIQIRATAVKLYTVQFLNLDGSTAAASQTVSSGTLITLGSPDDSAIPAYHHFIYWKLTNDGTGSSYTSGGKYDITANTVFYAYYAQTDAEVVNQFVGVQLHFDVDVIPVSDTSDTGNCRGENGYYSIAKAVYVTFTSSQKSLFRTSDDYAEARARFSAWATANGETYNPNTGNITTSIHNNNGDNLNSNNGNNNMIIIICVIAAISATSLLVLTILKKKNRK